MGFEIATMATPIKIDGFTVNRFSHVCAGAKIGKNVMIGSFCYIAPTAIIGDNTRIQNHVCVWDGVTIGENCFIGPHTSFTNCKHPEKRLTRKGPFTPDKTIIGDNVTIGANTTIIAPITLGDNVFIEAAATVIRDRLNTAFIPDTNSSVDNWP